LLGDASKAKNVIGWEPSVKFNELVEMMLDAELKEKFEANGIVPVDPSSEWEKGFYINKAKELISKRK
jgi:hypothetical protein